MTRHSSRASQTACRSSIHGTTRKKGNVPPTEAGKENEILECSNCEEKYPASQMIIQEKTTYCKTCFDEIFDKCSECKDIFRREDLHYIDDAQEQLCDECYADAYEECASCGTDVAKDDVTYYGDDAYCESCRDEYLFFCESCDEYHHIDDSIEVGGYLYCESCGEDSGECDVCGTRYFYDDMEEYGEGGGYICRRCKKKQNVTRCVSCQGFFDKADIDASTGFCLQCTEAKLEKEAEVKITDDDVIAAYPELDKRIDEIFDRSAYNRSANARSFAMMLKREVLPTVDFDFDKLTYKTEYGEKSINDLKSPRNSVRKMLKLLDDGESKAAVMDIYIDKIANTLSDIKKLLTDEKASTKRQAMTALKVRIYKEMAKKDVKAKTDSLEGSDELVYDGKKYTVLITKNPAAILAKSTSQCWENKSCEKLIRGQYGKGAFSDIANSNLVCYIFNDKGLPIARLMIRWCITDKKEIDFGLENKWYICTVDPKDSETFEDMGTSTFRVSTGSFLGGLPIQEATRFVEKIIKKRTGSKPFDSCTTPYVYDGYSDTAGSGHTRIKYRK